MNPEFRRNVWLEVTPLRLVVLVAVLLFAFFAAALTEGFAGPGSVARWAYYFLVVVWGTRSAARSVVGEIRDRTWDSQRLSSLKASTMMWGKLFGSTVFTWIGGAICLAVIMAEVFQRSGAAVALLQCAYYIALGVIAQGASLLTSLIAAGRRQGRSQFEVFVYQLVGIAAGLAVWAIADPSGPTIGGIPHTDFVPWWGMVLPTQPFLLVSLAAFAGFMLLGNYRLMRLELKLRNGPTAWLGFLVFMVVYVAGFDAWGASVLIHADAIARRLYLAGVVSAGLTYLTIFLEPKDRVFFRWFGGEFASFHLGSAFSRLQCWMMSGVAALLLGGALVARLAMLGWLGDEAIVGALLGFMMRDMGLVVLMNMAARRRGGDLLALAVLGLLYGLMPPIIAGLQYETGQALFLPRVTDPFWLSPAAAWLEAIAVWVLTFARIALPEQQSKT